MKASKQSAAAAIRLRGVRHNNLKNISVDLPFNRLIVVTGLSGSGKSSLAFDTLFAEGQRRYIETFSPYARQFLDRMDKPQVDSIEGIPPAIAIEQRNSVRTTRSTVGTMTEICDYMKVLWPHVARLYCRGCGQRVSKDPPQEIWRALLAESGAADHSQPKAAPGHGPAADARPGTEEPKPGVAREVVVSFCLPLTEKLSLGESLELVGKQGYRRLIVDGRFVPLEQAPAVLSHPGGSSSLTIVQDCIKLSHGNRARFVEACEQAYHFGKNRILVWDLQPGQRLSGPHSFSNRYHCATCDIEYREPVPALFSFNHPLGACSTCRGFGRIISIDYNRAIPDRSRTLSEGVVKPWQTGLGAECQQDLMRMCRKHGIPTDVRFCDLPQKWQSFVLDGEPGYGKDPQHEWPRAWYGVKGYFRWLESKAYKMHVRVLLSRYRAYTPCPDCGGKRFKPEALLYKASMSPDAAGPNGRMDLSDFYALPVRDALAAVEQFAGKGQNRSSDPISIVFEEVRSRLGFLTEVGLGYITLDRPTRSLSGGETERVNLTTCLGTRLVNALFVLDEPSVGLHSRDTERLISILERLRDAGNTVVVVEHDPSVMRAADQILDLGPGHGATGGEVVFQGRFDELRHAVRSLTADYLLGRKSVPVPERRPVRRSSASGRSRAFDAAAAADRSRVDALKEAAIPFRTGQAAVAKGVQWLSLEGANRHNLKNLKVELPLGRFVCLTGVSGSGKTTLARDVIFPALAAKLNQPLEAVAETAENAEESGDSEIPTGCIVAAGWEPIERVVVVDQSALSRTPRSNPAVYVGAFDDIRKLYAGTELARQRGLSASSFSFNSAQGQCERCRGAGFEKIEMQFLSDVFIRCPDCDGRRYRSHILEIKLKVPDSDATDPGLSIADLLDCTIDEVVDLLGNFEGARAGARAGLNLMLLQQVGLGYLKMGQPINTLSGGESQRLKLVRELAAVADKSMDLPGRGPAKHAREASALVGAGRKTTLFLFDEPTTGLHFDDVGVLLKVFQRLVDAGQSVLVIEHNLDVIKSADWVIDLGPEAGDGGGQIVAQGTPEEIAACTASHTGRALAQVLGGREGVRA